MNTDTPFYRLFQERPETVFELAGLPVPPHPAYRLHAEEVKQTAFRPGRLARRPRRLVMAQEHPAHL